MSNRIGDATLLHICVFLMNQSRVKTMEMSASYFSGSPDPGSIKQGGNTAQQSGKFKHYPAWASVEEVGGTGASSG